MKAKIIIEFTTEEKEALEEAIDYFRFKSGHVSSFTKESRRLDRLMKALEGILNNEDQ